MTSTPFTTSTPVISSTLATTKIPLDTSWKKNGIEDRALRAVASLGDYCISFCRLQNKCQFLYKSRIEFDNAETAIMWIKRGANVNGIDKDLETPLHKTAYKG